MKHPQLIPVSCLCLALGAACLGPDDVPLDLGVDAAPPADAGPREDATPADADQADAALPDQGEGDASTPDLSGPDVGAPDATLPDGAAPQVTVTNAASNPFAAGTGALSLLGSSHLLASTATTVVLYRLSDGRPDPSYLPFVLTSTQFGGNAAGSSATHSDGSADFGLFLPTGAPQVGALDLLAPGAVLTEAALAQPLSGGFSADLRVHHGFLLVSDAPFGAPSSVRAYDLAAFAGASASLVEAAGRRFTLPSADLDGDSSDEQLVAGRLGFSPDGTVGLVAFTVLGNSAPALAGGVLAFDLATGAELGRVLVPTADSSTVAQGFVGGFVIDEQHLYVVTAEKQFAPTFAELGGHLSVYELESLRPFQVRDQDSAALYDQPRHRLATSDDNPVGLAVIDDVVLVVNAPFFLDGSLDVYALGASLVRHAPRPLGGLYLSGFSVPGDPVRVPGARDFLLATEAGVLRFSVGAR